MVKGSRVIMTYLNSAGPLYIVGRHAYFQLFVIDPRVNICTKQAAACGPVAMHDGALQLFVENHKIV